MYTIIIIALVLTTLVLLTYLYMSIVYEPKKHIYKNELTINYCSNYCPYRSIVGTWKSKQDNIYKITSYTKNKKKLHMEFYSNDQLQFTKILDNFTCTKSADDDLIVIAKCDDGDVYNFTVSTIDSRQIITDKQGETFYAE